MSRTRGWWIALLGLACLAREAPARVLLSQEEALAAAFPEGSRIERRQRFLTRDQVAAAARLAHGKVESEMWTQYIGRDAEGRTVGTVYFETHVVRTLPETLMVVVAPGGALRRVEVVAFAEPPDYLPKPAWFAQFQERSLDDDLALQRGLRTVTGATLSARAATACVRRVLAVHAVLEGRTDAPSAGSDR
jgi:hypothetical protein